jgi:hypothetical protein
LLSYRSLSIGYKSKTSSYTSSAALNGNLFSLNGSVGGTYAWGFDEGGFEFGVFGDYSRGVQFGGSLASVGASTSSSQVVFTKLGLKNGLLANLEGQTYTVGGEVSIPGRLVSVGGSIGGSFEGNIISPEKLLYAQSTGTAGVSAGVPFLNFSAGANEATSTKLFIVRFSFAHGVQFK